MWPLALALAPLILLSVNNLRARGAFWPGFFFALGFFVLHLLWLPQSFAPYSGGFFWLLYPPLLAVLGVFWGIVTWLARLLGGRGVGALWLLPALWVVMEWARTQGVFAFPWGVLGYIWVGTLLAQAADAAGVYGLSLLTLAVGGCRRWSITRSRALRRAWPGSVRCWSSLRGWVTEFSGCGR